MSKRRVTITVDDVLIHEASLAVSEGRAESVSAWVNEALIERLTRDRRLRALTQLIADYESEYGEITETELAEQALRDRDAAAAMRAPRSRRQR